MKRQEKERIVGELREKFGQNNVVILTRYTGLKVHELNQLRNQLKKVSVDYHVVKNTLVRRAMLGTDVGLLREQIQGPLAIALTNEDIVPAAKLVAGFMRDHPRLRISAGLERGRVLDSDQIEQAAKLPEREELVGKLLFMMNSPVIRLMNVMTGVVAKFVRTLDAIQKQKASSD